MAISHWISATVARKHWLDILQASAPSFEIQNRIINSTRNTREKSNSETFILNVKCSDLARKDKR